ncbi:hypothetical protein [Flavobacterium sp.]|uniref:glycoside hydrolase family 19 protein n=1 Tax=Flavobacterium sp. TaxID=239 RepID=UPI00286E74B7|nr:hypothetical protein [Flavobacterium sp.]
MTRIRNVGGTITKTTGGDHNIYSQGNIVQNAGGTISEIGKEKGVSFGEPEKPKKIENITQLTDIYFAKKLLTPVFEDTEEAVVAIKGENEKKIRARFIKEKKIKKADIISYTPEKVFKIAKGEEKVTIKYKKKVRDEVSFPKITETKIKKKIWVIAICDGLAGKLTIEMNENKLSNTELVYENPIKFLIEKDEKTKIEFDLAKDKTKEPNIFAKEITLQPKSVEDVKKLIEKFNKRTDKKAQLFTKGEITETTDQVIYPNPEHEFKNKDKERLIVSGAPCFCNRDITLEEIKSIVLKMRSEEGIKTKYLFSSENCPLDSSDKTYERLTEELNSTMNKYHINTCIRKIHFLAQSYHESARYDTTLEGASGKGYNPGEHSNAKKMENTEDGDGPRYKGRGIIQLTWRKNQMAYFSYILKKEPTLLNNKKIEDLFDRGALNKEKYIYYANKLDEKGNVMINPKTKKAIKEKIVEEVDVDSASLIAKNLHFAFDSAGWYWENLGNVTATNENINIVADGDNVLKVSQCINGRVKNPYGLEHRKTFTKSLKVLFDYDDGCINKI